MFVFQKFKVANLLEILAGKKPILGRYLRLSGCLDGCRDHTENSGIGTRIWNRTGRTLHLQVRVDSVLKKVYCLDNGHSKRIKCQSLYRAYTTSRNAAVKNGGCMSSLLHSHDAAFHLYIWVHEAGGGFSKTVKYISLQDLHDCSEITIVGDRSRGRFSVQKKRRSAGCCFTI